MNGKSTPPLSGNGLPVESNDANPPEDQKKIKLRTEIRVMWSILSRFMKMTGGKLQTIDVNGIEYFSISFPLDRWQMDKNGVWMPKELISADGPAGIADGFGISADGQSVGKEADHESPTV